MQRQDLVCRLSNMEGANPGRRLTEQGRGVGGICTTKGESTEPMICFPLPNPAVPRSLSPLPGFHHPSATSLRFTPGRTQPGELRLTINTAHANQADFLPRASCSSSSETGNALWQREW